MRKMLFAVLMLVSWPAAAENVVRDISPAELKAQLETWGYQVFAHEDEEDRPQLLVNDTADDAAPEHKGMAMRMTGCVPEDAPFYDRRCDGYEFRAYLTPGFPIKDKVYADWNRDFGHTRAFIKEGHPRLAWRVSLAGGVTWDHVRATVDIWRTELVNYIDHLNASVMD